MKNLITQIEKAAEAHGMTAKELASDIDTDVISTHNADKGWGRTDIPEYKQAISKQKDDKERIVTMFKEGVGLDGSDEDIWNSVVEFVRANSSNAHSIK